MSEGGYDTSSIICATSGIIFSIFTITSGVCGFNYLHYRNLNERPLSQLLTSPSSSKSVEVLARGKVEGIKLLESRMYGDKIGPIVYSEYNSYGYSQYGARLNEYQEKQYVDFNLAERGEKCRVQVTQGTEILARNVYRETKYESQSFWKGLGRAVLQILNIFLFTGRIQWETHRVDTEDVLPIGASICVAGYYLTSAEKPLLLANIVAFSKEEILKRYWKVFTSSLTVQVIAGLLMAASGYYIYSKKRRIADREREYERQANIEAPEGLECKICLGSQASVIFDPCKHLCCCRVCADSVLDCPICRQHITGKVIIHIS